jgi:DNA polymerase III delta prime subunit
MEQIQEQLNSFCTHNQVPNILFHGPPGSGKKTLLQHLLQTIYQKNKENIQKYVICVNCAHAHGKGIKFIREELKFFAKTHIHNNGGHFFKSIILTNGDKLTTDAQSALRRCIENFTFNTRFFIVVEDKYRLLKPILSRFCEIYVPSPPQKTFYQRQIGDLFSDEQKKEEEKEQHLEKDILSTMEILLKKKEKKTFGYHVKTLFYALFLNTYKIKTLDS